MLRSIREGALSSGCTYRLAAPVDKLLFLKRRVDSKLTEAAVLVSSQSGQLKFWSIFGNRNLLGEDIASPF